MAPQSAFVLIDNSNQDLRRFRCGKPLMDSFLAQHAAKNALLGLSMTWVLLDDDSGERKKQPVVAYYTLAGGAVTRETLPTHQALPSYPVPVTLLARLAVSTECQGRGLGEKTLVTALRQAVLLSNKGLPSFGVVLDVLDEDALRFYQRFDMFHSFSDNPMRLFVPMQGMQYL